MIIPDKEAQWIWMSAKKFTLSKLNDMPEWAYEPDAVTNKVIILGIQKNCYGDITHKFIDFLHMSNIGKDNKDMYLVNFNEIIKLDYVLNRYIQTRCLKFFSNVISGYGVKTMAIFEVSEKSNEQSS